METDGYDANFVDEVPDYLKCVICHYVLRNPVLFVECGHRLCNGCFENMKKYATERNIDLLCPHDRMKVELNQVVDDKGIARVALDLKVKCNNVSKGCEWIGDLRNLQAHLDNNCSNEGKKDVTQLFSIFSKRMERCEKRLQEKDKQIENLQKELKQSQGEKKNVSQRLTSLTKRMETCEKRLTEKEKQTESLQKELKQSQEELGQIKKEISEKLKGTETKKKSASNQPSPAQAVPSKDVTMQIKALQERVLNVVQYIPYQTTVFEWKLVNYAHHEDIGEEVFSPMFYSYLNGHCCRIGVDWYGKQNGRLGVAFYLCEGIYKEVPNKRFNMGITFETCSKDGEMKVSTITKKQISDNYDDFIIRPENEDEKRSDGFGDDHFLNMPSLKNFIINDSLSIKCTLWNKQKQ